MPESIDFTKPVQTRAGWPVRILCTDGLPGRPITGFVMTRDGTKLLLTWLPNGRHRDDEGVSPSDIFQAPEQIRGWVNVYRLSSGGVSFGRVQHSRENAEDVARSSAAPRIACIEINVPEGHGLEGDDA